MNLRGFQVGRNTVFIFVIACYVLGGRFGYLLAVPPTYALTIWPPAGIALSAVLLRGPAIWPAILVGSLATQLACNLDGSSSEAIARSFALSSIVAIGSVIQAVVGGWSVRRFGGFPNALRKSRQVFALLTYGGVFSCLISASVGVVSQFLLREISADVLFETWLTSWIGDCFGVFLVTPIALSLFTAPRQEWLRRAAIIAFLTGISVAGCLGAVVLTARLERRDLRDQVLVAGEHLRGALLAETQFRMAGLYALQAFLSQSTAISAAEFSRFSSLIMSHTPSVALMEWAPRIGMQDRGDLIITEAGKGGLVPAAKRSEYFPVRYIEPMEVNRAIIGFDLASEPLRREVLTRARARNALEITAPLTLVPGRQGLIVVAPVWRRGSEPVLPLVGTTQIAGFVLAAIQLSDLDRFAFMGYDRSLFNYWLSDETDPASPALLSSNATMGYTPYRVVERGLFGISDELQYVHAFEVGGRQLVFRMTPTEEFISRNRVSKGWLVLMAGMLFASVVSAFSLIVTGHEGELKELLNEMTEQAHTDALTGLANRRSMIEALQGELRRIVRFELVATVLAIDVDYFKRINDGYGHDVGDKVLVQLADVLRSCSRGTDFAARIGGEEFIVLLPGTDRSGAAEMAERVRKLVESSNVVIDELSISITVSIGVSMMKKTDEDWMQVVRRADEAMYRAKAMGRNCVMVEEVRQS